MATETRWEWHPVTPDRWGDLERLFGPLGAVGGCWCMYWRKTGSAWTRGSSRTLGPVDDTPVWSITCFYVARGHRRQGVMRRLLQAAVAFAAARGARVIEAYPVDPAGRRVLALEAYTGLVPVFAAAGFVEVARRSERRPVMRYAVPGEGGAAPAATPGS